MKILAPVWSFGMSGMSNFATQQDGELEGHPQLCVECFCQFIVKENAGLGAVMNAPILPLPGIALEFTPRIITHLSSSSLTTQAKHWSLDFILHELFESNSWDYRFTAFPKIVCIVSFFALFWDKIHYNSFWYSNHFNLINCLDGTHGLGSNTVFRSKVCALRPHHQCCMLDLSNTNSPWHSNCIQACCWESSKRCGCQGPKWGKDDWYTEVRSNLTGCQLLCWVGSVSPWSK